jgi:hypothetical protein
VTIIRRDGLRVRLRQSGPGRTDDEAHKEILAMAAAMSIGMRAGRYAVRRDSRPSGRIALRLTCVGGDLPNIDLADADADVVASIPAAENLPGTSPLPPKLRDDLADALDLASRSDEDDRLGLGDEALLGLAIAASQGMHVERDPLSVLTMRLGTPWSSPHVLESHAAGGRTFAIDDAHHHLPLRARLVAPRLPHEDEDDGNGAWDLRGESAMLSSHEIPDAIEAMRLLRRAEADAAAQDGREDAVREPRP